MIPKRIEGATRYLGAPIGWDPEKDGECSHLAIVDTHMPNGAPLMISAWEPTPAEIEAIVARQAGLSADRRKAAPSGERVGAGMTAGGGQGSNLRGLTMPGVDRSTRQRRADKAAGMAAAIAWRESRRCQSPVADPSTPTGVRTCNALAFQPCVHRPNGAA